MWYPIIIKIQEVILWNIHLQQKILKQKCSAPMCRCWLISGLPGACRMLAPVIEEIASENEGKIKVGKVNVDENPDLARKYRVMSIPTVLVFKNGELTATSVGVDSKENILKLLEK